MTAVLNLALTVDERHVVECAQALQQRLKPDQWKVLASLAAEILARHEAAAAGQKVLVLTATPEETAAVAQGRAVAGL